MQARTIGWIVAVLIIALFGFVAMFGIEAEMSSRDLAKAQTDRRNAEEDLSKTRTSIERAQERVSLATKFSTAKAKLKEEIEPLQKGIRSGNEKVTAETKAWNDERDAFEKTLSAVRKATVGTKVTGITTGGIVHDSATVMAVNKGTVSIETETGVQKLATAKLPPELAEKLKPDWNPVLEVTESLLPKEPAAVAKNKEPERDLRYPDDPPPGAAPAAAASSPAAPAAPAKPKENPVTAELTKHKAAMTVLQTSMRTAELTLADRRATVSRLEGQVAAAKARGKSVSLPPELAQARQSVETILAQFEVARKQYAAMQIKLSELTQKEADWVKANP
jgi:hypothetical protein